MVGWPFWLSLRLASRMQRRILQKGGFRLPVLGLSLAIAVLILALSVVNGFEVAMRERVLSVFPQVMVYSREAPSLNQKQIAWVVRQEEVTASAPVQEMAGVLIAHEQKQGVLITSIDPEAEKAVNKVPKYMRKGQWSELSVVPFSMVVGQSLAKSLQLKVGDLASLMLPNIDWGLTGFSARSKRFRVVGIFDTGTELDQNVVYITLSSGRALAGRDFTEGMRLTLTDLFLADRLLQKLYREKPSLNTIGSSWMSRQGALYEAIGLQKQIMFVLLSLLIAVAAFNVTSQLVILVEEHRPDIAILKTLGAGEHEVRFIFLLQGVGLGVIGTLLGLIIGFIACDVLATGVVLIERWSGLSLLGEYFVNFLPYERLSGDFVGVACVSLTLCALASWIPAHQAGKMVIIEGLQDGS